MSFLRITYAFAVCCAVAAPLGADILPNPGGASGSSLEDWNSSAARWQPGAVPWRVATGFDGIPRGPLQSPFSSIDSDVSWAIDHDCPLVDSDDSTVIVARLRSTPTAAELVLVGLSTLGFLGVGRSVRRVELFSVAEWFSPTGPLQIGYAVAVSPESLSGAPLDVHHAGVSVRPIGHGRTIAPRAHFSHKKERETEPLIPRAPPFPSLGSSLRS